MNIKFLNKIQKTVCFTFLIASCLVLISSFCFFSSGWGVFQVSGNNNVDNFYSEGLFNQSVIFTDANSAKTFYVDFYNSIQTVNNLLFYTALVTIVLIAVSGIVGNFTRKKYYKSNLITGVLASVVAVVMSIITIVSSIALKSDFGYIEADIQQHYAVWAASNYPTSTITDTNCIIGIIVPIVLIIVAGLYATFVILKYLSSQKEINQNVKEVQSND